MMDSWCEEEAVYWTDNICYNDGNVNKKKQPTSLVIHLFYSIRIDHDL